jgi:hypothetical protein
LGEGKDEGDEAQRLARQIHTPQLPTAYQKRQSAPIAFKNIFRFVKLGVHNGNALILIVLNQQDWRYICAAKFTGG